MTSTGSLLDVLDALLRQTDDSSRELVVGHFNARRAGRNCVWRVTSNGSEGSTFYAKVFADEPLFRRELLGYELARDIAAQCDLFVPPDVVELREQDRVIVTKAIPGEPLATLLVRAFRLDQNPLGRRRPIADALNCVQASVDWLRALSGRSLRLQGLLDHSFTGISSRVRDKCDRILVARVDLPASCIEMLESVCQTLLRPHHEGHAIAPVFGDASPGNFVWNGTRVGAIDFEDLGVGDPTRDIFTLDFHLSRMARRWNYRRCCELRQMLAADKIPSWKRSVYALEYAIDAVSNTLLLDARPAGTPAERTAIRRLSDAASFCHQQLQARAEGGRILGA